MLAYKSTNFKKAIWRIRHTEKTRSGFEVGSEPQSSLFKFLKGERL